MSEGVIQTHSLRPAGSDFYPTGNERRVRLTDRIMESLSRNIVTAVFAPPGSGKSRVLCDARAALEAQGVPVAFLACAPDCTDPETFAERLRLATSAALAPVTPESVIAGLCGIGPNRQTAYLLIDDFHHADHKAQRQLIVESFHRADGSVRVLATARHRFRCGMGSLLIDGKMEEIGLAELAFTPSEARAQFPATLRPDEEKALGSIIRRAGGWGAALAVVKRRLARGERLTEIAGEYSGTMREFTAYFEDALSLVPPETAGLLLTIAPLEILATDLVEAVTSRQAEFSLMRAVDACPFVTFEKGLFSIHPLFRTYLTAVARQRDPQMVDLVLLTAADWHQSRHEWVAAASCRSKAGHGEEAARLLCRHADEIFAREGKSESLTSMIQQLTPIISRSPENLFWISRSAVFHGDFGRVARLIDDPDTILGGSSTLRMQLINILLAFGFEEFDRVRQEGARWLVEAEGAAPIDRATIAIALAMSCMAVLDPIKGTAAIDVARAETARSDSQYLRAWIAIVAALQLLDAGMTLDALRKLEHILSELDPGAVIRPTIELLRAACLYDNGALDQAARLTDRYLLAGLRHGVADTAIAGIRVAVLIKSKREGVGAALALADSLEETVEQRFGARARSRLRLLRIEVVLGYRDSPLGGAPALRLADLDVLAQSGIRHCPAVAEQIRLALAGHHLAQGETRQAIAITSTIMTPAATNRRFRVHTEASILRAAAHLAEGDNVAAIKWLWTAIERAAPEGMRQCFIDNAILFRPLAPALMVHARRLQGSIDPACIAVVEAMSSAWGVSFAVAEPAKEEDGPADPLTPVETRVLTFAASGLKNADIAAQMLIAVPTIKWHLHNIFNKWEVKTRTAAIAKARANGMLA